jgi:hypothetical protein
MEYTVKDIELLKTRAINGNQALYDYWTKCLKIEDDNEFYKKMELFDEKLDLLKNLCDTVKLFGFKECLYNDGRQCFTIDGWLCYVCTKG